MQTEVEPPATPMTLWRYRDIARRSRALSGAEYRTLDALLSFAGNSLETAPGPCHAFQRCHPSLKHLAAATGRSKHTVRTHINSLQERGWIRKHWTRQDKRAAVPLVQFLIPLTEPEGSWEGPVVW